VCIVSGGVDCFVSVNCVYVYLEGGVLLNKGRKSSSVG